MLNATFSITITFDLADFDNDEQQLKDFIDLSVEELSAYGKNINGTLTIPKRVVEAKTITYGD